VAPGADLQSAVPGPQPGPYLAETYPVSVEEDYLLVEI
jgi:hypothetical protein